MSFTSGNTHIPFSDSVLQIFPQFNFVIQKVGRLYKKSLKLSSLCVRYVVHLFNRFSALQKSFKFSFVIQNPSFSAINGVSEAIAGKQDALTFDSSPTSGSSNPVTSGGIYTAIANKMDKVTSVGSSSKPIYINSSGVPTACSYSIGTAASYGVTTSVTSGSSSLVTSGAVYTAINSIPVGTQELYLVESFTINYTIPSGSWSDLEYWTTQCTQRTDYTFISPSTSLKIAYKGYTSSKTDEVEVKSYDMTSSIGRDIFKLVTNFNNVSLPNGVYTLGVFFGYSYYGSHTIKATVQNNTITSCTANGHFSVYTGSSEPYKGVVSSFRYSPS